MRVKLMTFRYSSSLGGFDSDPLTVFCADKEVLSFREHFFCVGDVPHLTCVIVYQPLPLGEAPTAEAPTPARLGGWRDHLAQLDTAGRQRFETLREWRNERAREEGVPPYIVLTNKQLVEIAVRRPDSLTALGHVPGIGKAKIARHGKTLLRRLGVQFAAPADQATSTPEATLPSMTEPTA
jgi:hypothetical protein